MNFETTRAKAVENLDNFLEKEELKLDLKRKVE